jgi:flavodoxin
VNNVRTVVLYSTRSGNTRKIAEEIAAELNCESVRISQTNSTPNIDLNNYDLIFIGTGIQTGNPNEHMTSYLKTIGIKKPKSFAIFVTWGGAGKTDQMVIDKLKKTLKSKGQKVIENCYTCYGGWHFLRRGHPNSEDAKTARKWAKKTANDTH